MIESFVKSEEDNKVKIQNFEIKDLCRYGKKTDAVIGEVEYSIKEIEKRLEDATTHLAAIEERYLESKASAEAEVASWGKRLTEAKKLW